jgi:hypothetical protein
VNWKLDPLLLRISNGRIATTLVFPTALLETRGAKSGLPRRNAIIYFHDGNRVTIVASNAGATRHPAWYHNLQAHPDVTFGGIPCTRSSLNPGTNATDCGRSLTEYSQRSLSIDNRLPQ